MVALATTFESCLPEQELCHLAAAIGLLCQERLTQRKDAPMLTSTGQERSERRGKCDRLETMEKARPMVQRQA